MKMIEITKEELRLNIEALKTDKLIFNKKVDAKIEMLGEVEKLMNSHQHLSNEIDRLAEFIINNVEGEPSENQGAVDTAIRLLNIHYTPKKVVKECGYNDRG